MLSIGNFAHLKNHSTKDWLCAAWLFVLFSAPTKLSACCFTLWDDHGVQCHVQRTFTHFVRGGKYHCMADLLFVLFGFSCFAYTELETYLLVWLNPNQSNRTSACQWYFPLISGPPATLLVSSWSTFLTGSKVIGTQRFYFEQSEQKITWWCFNSGKASKQEASLWWRNS